jgi:hypothetical protein
VQRGGVDRQVGRQVGLDAQTCVAFNFFSLVSGWMNLARVELTASCLPLCGLCVCEGGTGGG